MSEMELYGLMAIAKEHQAAVERASKGLDGAAGALVAAGKGFDQARAEIRQAAAEAMRAAVANEAEALAAPLRQAAQEAAKAAAATSAAGKTVKSAWGLALFTLGALVGAGAVYAYMSTRPPLYGVSVDQVIDYVSKQQPKPKGR